MGIIAVERVSNECGFVDPKMDDALWRTSTCVVYTYRIQTFQTSF